MNPIERMLLEQMESEKFNKTIEDDFSFTDSLIDQNDLDKIFDKEMEEDQDGFDD